MAFAACSMIRLQEVLTMLAMGWVGKGQWCVCGGEVSWIRKGVPNKEHPGLLHQSQAVHNS